ncbi:hypothetical protein C808_00573 [Lachnospiraceae bacterium M18-1]|nr:hypothetical protein C808_00573 [Lachnospiraceae bacterium M18-1]
MLKKQVAVELMKHLVTHDWHGYSQVSRWGDGEGTCDAEVGGKVYKLEQGDRDCSSGVISAYEAAGISCGGATYTGNMRSCMCATGNFKWHPMSSGYVAQAGDIYLDEACHTAMCLSAVPDMLMEFAISENNGIDGAEGDQTGHESHIRTYYDYPWDGILECINREEAQNGTTVSNAPASEENNTLVGLTGGATRAILEVTGQAEQYYLDGHTIRPIGSLEELKAIKDLYKDIQTLERSKKQFQDLKDLLNR